MKKQLSILAGGLIAFALPMQSHAQDAPVPLSGAGQSPVSGEVVTGQKSDAGAAPMTAQADFGPKAKWGVITEVKITNFQGEALGRIEDLTIDLTNGRVVEVLVVSGQTLRFGGKTVAVPPQALISDAVNKVYKINMSAEAFKAAPAFELSKWADSTQSDKVAAAYRYFGQSPYFLETGEASHITAAGAPLVPLGIVERMSKFTNMNVENLKGVRLGQLETLVLDVPNGLILNVYIQAPTNMSSDSLGKSETIISPTELSFNAKHNGLVLDVSKVVYKEEPHVIFDNSSTGQVTSSREEPNAGEEIDVALVQGTSARDINTTAQIYQSIRNGNLDAGEKVEVATLQGRVTLRGSVNSEATRQSIIAIAVSAVKIANVNSHILVTSQAQAAL